MEEIFLSKSLNDTRCIAETLAKQVQQGGIILLHGNLGSGKTTFVQGLAKGLGIKKRIISPTFIIVRSYEISSVVPKRQYASGVKAEIKKKDRIPDLSDFVQGKQVRDEDNKNYRHFFHVDLYRLQTEKEIEDVGIRELMKNKKNIIAIEWPERLGSLTPKEKIELHFETTGKNERKITIKN